MHCSLRNPAPSIRRHIVHTAVVDRHSLVRFVRSRKSRQKLGGGPQAQILESWNCRRVLRTCTSSAWHSPHVLHASLWRMTLNIMVSCPSGFKRAYHEVFCFYNTSVWWNATVSFSAICVAACPPWHRNARKLRARARRAVRRDSLTEEQACALLLHHGSALTHVALRNFRKMSWTCPNCSVVCGWEDASARRETAERRSPSRCKTWSLLVCGPA